MMHFSLCTTTCESAVTFICQAVQLCSCRIYFIIHWNMLDGQYLLSLWPCLLQTSVLNGEATRSQWYLPNSMLMAHNWISTMLKQNIMQVFSFSFVFPCTAEMHSAQNSTQTMFKQNLLFVNEEENGSTLSLICRLRFFRSRFL